MSIGPIHNRLSEKHSVGAHTRERILTTATCPAFKPHRIRTAGLSEAHLGFAFVRHKPDFGAVVISCRGRGEVLAGGRWRRCAEGSAYLMPAHALHAYRAVNGQAWDVCWVAYDEPPGGPSVIGVREPALVPCDPLPLHDAIRGLYRESSGPANAAVMRHWTELVHAHVLRLTGPWRGDTRLGKLWERVEEDVGRAWTIAELAARCSMSSETLRRLCQQQLRRSPMAHVAFLRMSRAGGMLATSDGKIDAIARAVGYENIFTFSAAFKRVMGVPPSRYRETHKL
ncbi:MAG: helix-turn-helix transcriptional regulator [Planctomycetes bacterium]|nr:helix-turn-helix transcriptional regulator [Planctomycetota bacterium]